MKRLGEIMGEPLEIERKWLIHYPSVDEMMKMPKYDYSEIQQTYTDYIEHNAYGRIRKRGKNGVFKYYKTFKKKITNLTRVEYEEEITEKEYLKIMQYKRKGFATIEKVRHTFDYCGLKYEVDVFPFWNDRAFMECEVNSEDKVILIPPCIKVIKEVSNDSRYNNSNLAQKVITENLE